MSDTTSFDALAKKVEGLGTQIDDLGKATKSVQRVFNIREGEDPLTSRPFMFLKLFGAMANKIRPDNAKVEYEHLEHFQKTVRDVGTGWAPQEGNSMLAPLGFDYLPVEVGQDEKCRQLKSLVANGTEADPDEMNWLRKRITKAAVSPAQSWLDSTLGGDLVAPPVMGEIIELLRNKEALSNAGARTIPLPAQGSIKFPRIITPTTGTMQTENQTTSGSTVGTGSLTLQAKKVVSLVNVPNELFRFATPAAEAVLRDDIAKTLALKVDLQGLEGQGNGTEIKGIIRYANIVQHTASKQDVNGNTLQPQDGYLMAGKIEENNAEMEGWIMRPLMWSKIVGFCADSVAAGDKAGQFVQALTRSLGDGGGKSWCEYKITKSAQVSRTRVKASGTNLSYVLGGMWSDFLIGMFGGIEFLASNVSDTAMANDLTVIRGIMLADAGPRHEGAFAICDQLIYT